MTKRRREIFFLFFSLSCSTLYFRSDGVIDGTARSLDSHANCDAFRNFLLAALSVAVRSIDHSGRGKNVDCIPRDNAMRGT